MSYDLLIKNGLVYAPEELGQVAIAVADGKIVALGHFPDTLAKNVIDAEGKLVFPGVIETHAHMLLPLAGTITKNDFYSGTVAGAFGGVTTLVDFADQQKGHLPMEAVEKRKKQAEGQAVVDYSFHVTLTDINRETLEQLEAITSLGLTSFKFYTIYKDDGLYVEDGELLEAFKRVAALGALATVHAENESIIRRATENLVSQEQVTSQYYSMSKPDVSEEEAIRRVILLAQEAEVPLLIRHVSSAGGVLAINEARNRGQQVFGETCPHYLILTREVYNREDACNYIVHPPIRGEKDREALWEGIFRGDISVIGTDDCAFTREQKKQSTRFFEIPGGMPGIETRLTLMYSEGVGKKRISTTKLVEITSTNVAKIYGLYPRKGTIRVGSDADLVIFDPSQKVRISANGLHQMADWTPFEGWETKGQVEMTLSKGKVIIKDGQFLGEVGDGAFLSKKKC